MECQKCEILAWRGSDKQEAGRGGVSEARPIYAISTFCPGTAAEKITLGINLAQD